MAGFQSRRRGLRNRGHREADNDVELKPLKRIVKKDGCAKTIATNGLCSYAEAMTDIGTADRLEKFASTKNAGELRRIDFVQRFSQTSLFAIIAHKESVLASFAA